MHFIRQAVIECGPELQESETILCLFKYFFRNLFFLLSWINYLCKDILVFGKFILNWKYFDSSQVTHNPVSPLSLLVICYYNLLPYSINSLRKIKFQAPHCFTGYWDLCAQWEISIGKEYRHYDHSPHYRPTSVIFQHIRSTLFYWMF